MEKEVKHKNLSVWMPMADYERFLTDYNNSSCQSKSEYFRRMLFDRPITIIYRNRSLDEFLEMGVKIRRDLREILKRYIFYGPEREFLKAQIAVIELNSIKTLEHVRKNSVPEKD